ncbi:hypothetical protein CS542_00930 [Pedobacter sp. IW39]|nr:hypothetical protein CS542_00930 [Pedobacter sp. IW39]
MEVELNKTQLQTPWLAIQRPSEFRGISDGNRFAANYDIPQSEIKCHLIFSMIGFCRTFFTYTASIDPACWLLSMMESIMSPL